MLISTPILKLRARSSAVAQFTVVVSDTTESRSSIASVFVNIILPAVAKINLESASIIGKTTETSSIQLTATIGIPAFVKGNASWSLLSGNTIDLTAVALTPTFLPFQASAFPQLLSMILVLPPNSLHCGESYTFGLTSLLSYPGISTSSAITVKVNFAPSSGSFLVSPASGFALIDSFFFSCFQWTSDHLPLSYQFSYVSQTQIKLSVRSLSIVSYGSSVLPAGLPSKNDSVLCVADVFDSLNANRTVFSSVKVISTESFLYNERTAPVISSMISRNFNTSAIALFLSNVDDVMKGTAFASFIINHAHCALAPNCTSLNRSPCYSTSHTCGSCLSSYYIGQDGDSNEKCYDPAFSLPSLSSSSSLILKSCAGNCSSHGVCKFSSLLSGAPVVACYDGDLSCKPVCSCFDGYKLSTNCDLTDNEVKEKMKLRDQIVDGIVSYIDHQDINEQSIISWINSVNEVSQTPKELSQKSVSSILQITSYALSSASSKGYSSNSLGHILTSLDSMATAFLSLLEESSFSASSANGRRLETQSNTLDSTAILQPLKNYSLLLVGEMVPGQTPKRFAQKNFRIHTENYQVTTPLEDDRRKLSSSFGCDSNHSISLPITSLEQLLRYSPSHLKIPVCVNVASNSDLMISVISSASGLFENSALRSDSASLYLSSIPCSSSDPTSCRVEIILNSNNHGTRMSEAMNTTYHCQQGDYHNHTVYCTSSAKNYTVHCNGKAEILSIHCPSSQLLPSCQGLFGNLASNIGCSLVSYTEENITCSCPLTTLSSNNNQARRALSSSSFSSSSNHSTSVATTVDINYVSLLQNIEGNFISNILSTQSLTASNIANSWDVVVTLGVLFGVIVAAMFLSYRSDKSVQTKISFENRVMHGSTSSSAIQRRNNLSTDPSHSDLLSRKGSTGLPMNVDIEELARQSLPDILSSTSSSQQSLKERIWREVKRHHRWVGVVYHFSPTFPRILRVVSLSTNIIVMLFIQSLTYGLTQGDDGSCSFYHNEEACLLPRSPYGSGGSKCYWIPDTDTASTTDGSCFFVQPDDSIGIVVFVAVISAFITAPLSLLSDWVIHHILAAPDEDPTMLNKKKRKNHFQSTVLSIFPLESFSSSASASSDLSSSTSPFVPTSFVRTALPTVIERKSSVERLRKFDAIVAKELNDLKNEIMAYRCNLTEESQIEEFNGKFVSVIFLFLSSYLRFLLASPPLFSLLLFFLSLCSFAFLVSCCLVLWSLDPSRGLSKWSEDYSSSLPFFQRLLSQLKGIISSSIAEELSIEVAIRQELYELHSSLEMEVRKFRLISSEVSKMKRLLFLFQRDLLPGINGEILESKECRENIVLSPVSSQKKMAGWFFLSCLNGGMLFYVFLFALSQDDHHQKAWGRSFAIWLLLEIALISTGMVVFMHIFLPSLIMKDVAKIKKKVTESINKYYASFEQEEDDDDDDDNKEETSNDTDILYDMTQEKEMIDRERMKNVKKQRKEEKEKLKKQKRNAFNAARYLFLSYRLASIFPELKASQIVLQFSSPWPRQSYQHIIDVKKKYDDRYTALSRSASIILIFFLTNLLSVPLAIQDMILSLIMAVTMGYTMLIHIQLYDIFPALVIIPTICFVGIVYLMNQGRKLRKAEEKIQKLAAKIEKQEKRKQHHQTIVDNDDDDDDEVHRGFPSSSSPPLPVTPPSLLLPSSTSPVSVVKTSLKNDNPSSDIGKEESVSLPEPVNTLNEAPSSNPQFRTRRQSLAHGITLTQQLQDIIEKRKVSNAVVEREKPRTYSKHHVGGGLVGEEEKKDSQERVKEARKISLFRGSDIDDEDFDDFSDDFSDDFDHFSDEFQEINSSDDEDRKESFDDHASDNEKDDHSSEVSSSSSSHSDILNETEVSEASVSTLAPSSEDHIISSPKPSLLLNSQRSFHRPAMILRGPSSSSLVSSSVRGSVVENDHLLHQRPRNIETKVDSLLHDSEETSSFELDSMDFSSQDEEVV
jgi:predicted XRE-type DNA-binding protein